MLQAHELLDRAEILYPDDCYISNLRRAVIDQDFYSIFSLVECDPDLKKAICEKNLHSIFRVFEQFNLDLKPKEKIEINPLEELRKAICNNNTNSIFRLMNLFYNENNKIEDMRKACLNHDLNSLFRIIDEEEIRKAVLHKNLWKIFDLIIKRTNSTLFIGLKRIFSKNLKINNSSLSRGQLRSKLWLVNELKNLQLDLGTVFIAAGWYSTIACLFRDFNLKIEKIRSFDIDPSCEQIAENFNKEWIKSQWRFKAATQNILDINYKSHSYHLKNSKGETSLVEDVPDTIINTSCEHIQDFSKWRSLIPKNKILILQSNNYFEREEHVNCSSDLKQFLKQARLKKILYQGDLDLDLYKRFMVIGIS